MSLICPPLLAVLRKHLFCINHCKALCHWEMGQQFGPGLLLPSFRAMLEHSSSKVQPQLLDTLKRAVPH